ncbi:MAG: TRAP transporter substrate-binding protein DctP, partial [Candidatus Aminicenantes bacterium]|nr:TRAP transporter substrate-binding protein DctP [Candidatus Aminicenantes bacterium]
IAIFAIGQQETWAQVKPVVLRLAQPQAIEHPQSQMVERIAEKIKTLTNGEVELKHYPAGQLGSAPDVFRQMVDGGIDFVIGGTDQLSSYNKQLDVFQTFYLFKDPDHMLRVMESPLATELFEKVRKESGIRIVNNIYFGTRILSTKNVKATKPEDLKGVKIRATPSPVWVENINALGATAVAMPLAEVYMALQTGTVEGQDNPLPGDKAHKFYEVQNNFILTNHAIGFSTIMVNEQSWNKIPAKYHADIERIFKEEGGWMKDEIIRQDAEIRKEFEAMGKEFIEPDREAFRSRVLTIQIEKNKDTYADLIKKIMEID